MSLIQSGNSFVSAKPHHFTRLPTHVRVPAATLSRIIYLILLHMYGAEYCTTSQHVLYGGPGRQLTSLAVLVPTPRSCWESSRAMPPPWFNYEPRRAQSSCSQLKWRVLKHPDILAPSMFILSPDDPTTYYVVPCRVLFSSGVQYHVLHCPDLPCP